MVIGRAIGVDRLLSDNTIPNAKSAQGAVVALTKLRKTPTPLGNSIFNNPKASPISRATMVEFFDNLEITALKDGFPRVIISIMTMVSPTMNNESTAIIAIIDYVTAPPKSVRAMGNTKGTWFE